MYVYKTVIIIIPLECCQAFMKIIRIMIHDPAFTEIPTEKATSTRKIAESLLESLPNPSIHDFAVKLSKSRG